MAFALPRLQLFEFNDLPWVPAAVRDTVVESLSRALAWGRMLEGLVAPFEAFLVRAGTRDVLEVGSGAGGPAAILSRAFAKRGVLPPKFVLTDLHPRVEAWTRARDEQPHAIDFEASPVDATCVPPALGEGRARSIINVLHHFPRPLATAVLQDAVRGSAGVFVAESFTRNPLMFANFAPTGIPALLLNPLLSPKDNLAKAALTWLTPAALGISLWDGLVSTMRVWSPAELSEMVAPFGAHWRWGSGGFACGAFGEGYYFYGVPSGVAE